MGPIRGRTLSDVKKASNDDNVSCCVAKYIGTYYKKLSASEKNPSSPMDNLKRKTGYKYTY